jgi:hypothetical protein
MMVPSVFNPVTRTTFVVTFTPQPLHPLRNRRVSGIVPSEWCKVKRFPFRRNCCPADLFSHEGPPSVPNLPVFVVWDSLALPFKIKLPRLAVELQIESSFFIPKNAHKLYESIAHP